jgi:hypothetical protein
MVIGRILAVSVVLAAFAPQASAGFFSRKPKANAIDRVPELLAQLRTAADEGQRATAAEELREFDGKSYPEIAPALVEALGRDTSPAVRAEAATSLGKLRPISQQNGYVLEQALNNDTSGRVRMAARQALWSYHLVGYRSSRPNDQTPEPPIAKSTGTRGNARLTGRESPEPPLAQPSVNVAAPSARRSPPPAAIPANPIRLDPQPLPRAPETSQTPRNTTSVPSQPQAGVTDGPALPPG